MANESLGNGAHPPAPYARALRLRSTDAERVLWRLLRDRRLAGAKFRRQRAFGPYILDFYSVENRLVIEADGSQHLTPAGAELDAGRTTYLERRGLRVLRFTNREILLEREAVIAIIERALAKG